MLEEVLADVSFIAVVVDGVVLALLLLSSDELPEVVLVEEDGVDEFTLDVVDALSFFLK